MLILREHPGDQGVDDAVKDKIVWSGHGLEQRCMPQQNVMEFMHNQHQQFFGCIRMLADERGVDPEPGLNLGRKLDMGLGMEPEM